MPAATCTSTFRYQDTDLRCGLPADHTTPTGTLPEGSAHHDPGFVDQLTGQPWSWWG